MRKTILIDGKPFNFEEELLDYGITQPMSHDEGVELLHTVKQLLDAKGLEFYLGYGTLLGAVRNHDIIPGDEDLDIIVREEARLLSLLPYLRDNGLKLIRAVKGNTYSFRKGERCYIDIYICRPIPKYSPWSLYCYSIGNKEYCPKSIWKKTQTIEFLGGTFLCPQPPTRILTLWYGEDWITPKSGHCFYYEVKSHWFWRYKLKPAIQQTIAWPYWRHLILRRFKTQAESLAEWKRTQTNAN